MKECEYNNVCVPTGDMIIGWCDEQVVNSTGFYFTNNLYHLYGEDVFGAMFYHVYYNSWFKKYIKLFKSVLKQELEKAFVGHPYFVIDFVYEDKFILEAIR